MYHVFKEQRDKEKYSMSVRETEEDILNPLVVFKYIKWAQKCSIFFETTPATSYIILNADRDRIAKCLYTIDDIGEYGDLISNINQVIRLDFSRFKFFENFNNGILLHGYPGVGKSMIANAILWKCRTKATVFSMHSLDVCSKSIGEDGIEQLFAKALSHAPSIILLEDIEYLCPNESNINSYHMRRAFNQLIKFFDDVQINRSNVILMATTSKLDSVNSALTRPGRFGIEFEVYLPCTRTRAKILEKLLEKIPNTLEATDVNEISSITRRRFTWFMFESDMQ